MISADHHVFQGKNPAANEFIWAASQAKSELTSLKIAYIIKRENGY